MIPAPKMQASASARASTAVRIVLVHHPARPELMRALIRQGYDVVVASDSRQACQLVEDLAPELVLIAMPDVVALCRQLRAERRRMAIVVLAVTRDPDDRIRALNAGADDCVGGSFQMAELTARIEAVRRRSSRGHQGDARKARSAASERR